ncbi:MAG: hypothetical protein K2M55_08530 [Muribaculaceae bacterium]|nr:hypothetical protein [Muribaculaceae bacterium]
MKRILILLAVLIAAVVAVKAAEPEPVRWRTIVKQTGPDTGTVTFRALVGEGWHLYGTELPADGPRPTTFDLSGSRGVKFTGEPTPVRAAVKARDELFGATLEWWDANIDFVVPFTLTSPDDARLEATISYMACNGETCRPPKAEKIATPIRFKTQDK